MTRGDDMLVCLDSWRGDTGEGLLGVLPLSSSEALCLQVFGDAAQRVLR
jgi:hypothetical protein